MAGPQLSEVIERLGAIEKKQDEQCERLDKMNGILETWQAFKTGGQIITWLAKIAAAVLGIVVFLKLGITSLLGGPKP